MQNFLRTLWMPSSSSSDAVREYTDFQAHLDEANQAPEFLWCNKRPKQDSQFERQVIKAANEPWILRTSHADKYSLIFNSTDRSKPLCDAGLSRECQATAGATSLALKEKTRLKDGYRKRQRCDRCYMKLTARVVDFMDSHVNH